MTFFYSLMFAHSLIEFRLVKTSQFHWQCHGVHKSEKKIHLLSFLVILFVQFQKINLEITRTGNISTRKRKSNHRQEDFKYCEKFGWIGQTRWRRFYQIPFSDVCIFSHHWVHIGHKLHVSEMLWSEEVCDVMKETLESEKLITSLQCGDLNFSKSL